jgi:aspartate aminotransferase
MFFSRFWGITYLNNIMESLSNRVTSVTPSLTLSVTNQAKALRAAGEEIYGLAGGEPDCDTPDFIKAGGIHCSSGRKNKIHSRCREFQSYARRSQPSLRLKITLTITQARFVSPQGAKQACFNAILAVIEEGDEVIIPSPYWVSYPEMVKLAGGVPVMVETKGK